MSPSCTCFLPQLFSARSRRSPSSDRNLLDSGDTRSSSSQLSNINSIQSYRYRYDVFISFRGPDTRKTFVDHLYAHLLRKGLMVFKDDIELRRGKSISPQLLKAIKDSRVSIVVFSTNYASSTWCLDEMAAIYNRHLESKQIVFPVFYDVDPSHVRKQNGAYEDAFRLYRKKTIFKHDSNKVDGWKRAMTCLAELAGFDVRKQPEFEEIEIIVEDVIRALGHRLSSSADDLVGIQLRVEALKSQLRLNSEDDGFRVLGIWGMDGIGKTTLATVLYDTISHHYQFDVRCFIEDVSKIYKDGGAIAVQKQIIRQTLKENNLDIHDHSEISAIITNRVCNMKLLIILDDVDQIEQLQELRIDPKLLCRGSRIIITTRDVHILKEYGADKIYEVELMKDSDAHDLLCRKAFKSDYSSSNFAELIPEVLKYAQGLPLAITLIGSFLCARSYMEWRAKLDELRDNPDTRIMKILQMSFEGLESKERDIFLHVACFFDGEKEDYVRRILDACDLHSNIGIPVIAEKSLITIKNQEIHMHKMLIELGKKNVRDQHPDQPRLWSRLWLYHDLHDAMITKQDAIEAEAIILNPREDVSEFKQLMDEEDLSKRFSYAKRFIKKMKAHLWDTQNDFPLPVPKDLEKLKVLVLSSSKFPGSYEFLSNSLRYLLWNGCPLTYFPSKFRPYNLVELNMPDSRIGKLWEGIQDLPALKRIDMSNSKNLKVTPCFEGMKNLERLDLTGCISLLEVHPSIGLLTELQFLSLQNCTSLVTLDFGYATRLMSLKVLSLSGCTRLKNTLNFSGLSNLRYLDMDECASVSTIDESVGALAELRFLSLRYCRNLVEISDGLNRMISLTTLDLYGCSKFSNLPLRGSDYSSHLESLIFIDLSFCNILEVPDAIGGIRCLERLNLQGNNFTELPSTLGRLHNLSYLNLSHCHKLQSLSDLRTESGPSNSVGRYFKTTSGSRNHRSGLYVFDSPNCKVHDSFYVHITRWIHRIFKEPLYFRCGFDLVLPWNENRYSVGNISISMIFHQWFEGGSIIRINDPVMPVNWLGFLFCVTFELNNHPKQSSSSHQSLSSLLPHPFYLSFESEYTEERFDMPLNLELNKVDGKQYLWMIYISQEHCHFVKTGAHITFKARKGLIVKEWGLRVVTKNDTKGSRMKRSVQLSLENVKVKQRSDSSNFEPKIQLPYNWLVSDEDEAERDEAKGKETHLFNLGLFN